LRCVLRGDAPGGRDVGGSGCVGDLILNAGGYAPGRAPAIPRQAGEAELAMAKRRCSCQTVRAGPGGAWVRCAGCFFAARVGGEPTAAETGEALRASAALRPQATIAWGREVGCHHARFRDVQVKPICRFCRTTLAEDVALWARGELPLGGAPQSATPPGMGPTRGQDGANLKALLPDGRITRARRHTTTPRR